MASTYTGIESGPFASGPLPEDPSLRSDSNRTFVDTDLGGGMVQRTYFDAPTPSSPPE